MNVVIEVGRLTSDVELKQTQILAPEHTKPTGIEIKISYPQSIAHLHIEADQIAKALEEEKEV